VSECARPHLHVSCAIIEEAGRILATQRSATMSLPLKWEFPGGKMHDGESPEACLHRELREELEVAVSIGAALAPTTHHYPSFTVTLYPLVCTIESGALTLHEHAAAAWLAPEELHTVDWAEADLPILAAYLAMRRSTR
jgi:8-oxo-dGTP diphosphatase